MKKNVGLIGRGKWGLKLKSKLSMNAFLNDDIVGLWLKRIF